MIWKCLKCRAAWFLLRFIHLFTNYLWNTSYVLNAKAVCIDLPSVCGPPTMCRWWDAAVNKQMWSLPSGILWSRGEAVTQQWLDVTCIYCTPTMCRLLRLFKDRIGDAWWSMWAVGVMSQAQIQIRILSPAWTRFVSLRDWLYLQDMFQLSHGWWWNLAKGPANISLENPLAV